MVRITVPGVGAMGNVYVMDAWVSDVEEAGEISVGGGVLVRMVTVSCTTLAVA